MIRFERRSWLSYQRLQSWTLGKGLGLGQKSSLEERRHILGSACWAVVSRVWGGTCWFAGRMNEGSIRVSSEAVFVVRDAGVLAFDEIDPCQRRSILDVRNVSIGNTERRKEKEKNE